MLLHLVHLRFVITLKKTEAETESSGRTPSTVNFPIQGFPCVNTMNGLFPTECIVLSNEKLNRNFSVSSQLIKIQDLV